MAAVLSFRSLQRVSLISSFRCSTNTARSFHTTVRWAEQYPKANVETFNKVVNTRDRVVLVDFYADWCGPCHQLSPILESLTTNPDIKTGSGLPLDLVKIDTDDEDGQSLGQRYKVRALPTVIAFRDGKAIDQFVGALNEPGVRAFLQKV